MGLENPDGVWFTDADVRQIPVFSGESRNTRVSVEQFDPTKTLHYICESAMACVYRWANLKGGNVIWQ